MWFRKLKKPKILYSKAGRILHPHIVVGEVGRDYVSMNITHSSSITRKENGKVKRANNVLLKQNPEKAYLVSDTVYIRPKKEYFSPRKGKYQITRKARDQVFKAIKGCKKIVK